MRAIINLIFLLFRYCRLLSEILQNRKYSLNTKCKYFVFRIYYYSTMLTQFNIPWEIARNVLYQTFFRTYLYLLSVNCLISIFIFSNSINFLEVAMYQLNFCHEKRAVMRENEKQIEALRRIESWTILLLLLWLQSN